MKNFKIIFVSLLVVLTLAACNELEQMGMFDLDETYLPGARADGPEAPIGMIASYDDYCDMVVIAWEPTVRTTTYDLYREGSLIAEDLVDTSFIDSEAYTAETEYWVYAKNEKGESIDSSSAIGRMSDTPPDPLSFAATDGEFEAKVDLTWEAVDFAKYYRVMRGSTVLNDSVEGLAWSDNVDAPQDDTEYSLVAFGVCGESSPVTSIGKADSLLKYSIIFNQNFDGLATGFDMFNETTQYLPRFQYTDGGAGTLLVSEVDFASPSKCLEAKFNDPSTAGSARSIQLVLRNFELLVGQRYRFSVDIKCPTAYNLHFAVDADENGFPSKGDGQESWLLPTAVNPNNGNLFGIKLSPATDWTNVSFEFPQSGTVEADVVDPDPTALGWTATTIQEGQENPKIMFAYWTGKNSHGGVAPAILIDNLKIELIK